jgi:hypothetical protein
VRIGVVLSGLYILMHVGVGLAFYGRWPPWQVYALPWLVIPVLLVQYRCEEIRMVVRIDDRSIAYTRINSPRQKKRRRRERLRWDEIDRIHLGNGSMLLCAGDRCIGLAHRLFPPAMWDELYLLIQLHLEPDFDLITPTPAQLRFERVQDRSTLKFIAEMALVTLIAMLIVGAFLGLMYLMGRPSLPAWAMPAIAGGVLAVCIAVMKLVRRLHKKRDKVNWRERIGSTAIA